MGVQFRWKWGTEPPSGCSAQNDIDRYRDPGSKARYETIQDYDREGLFFLVNPSGSKLWRWRYRFDGKEKLMALGEHAADGSGRVPSVRSQIYQ